ncbi:Cytochrome c551 peroxidase precursor [Rubripirellula lacrimiformis]|uniref:Cytochrome c551 peroxidase n=1 Tax=Rubripirellula lacrimiformis TaxID=1930273 RepID=A0A517NCD6_9BACT|nr:cytochrome c peroxidase [Rubripirellula lacrimiformis]QDT04794.1 Cytochrome c551 peroxidase precursor [Rubripirellula lacrimiformis]
MIVNTPTMLVRTLCSLIAMAATTVVAADFAALPKTATLETDSPQIIALGKKLFFDPRLSATGTVSCNSCHNLMEGGDDGRATSMGVDGLTGGRNSPTVWNAVFQSSQFWDGRAKDLAEQAKGPFVADVEMGMGVHDQVVGRIQQIPDYVREFDNVFGQGNAVTIDNAVTAIAAFERTLITPNAPLDHYLAGDKNALTDAQVRGMDLFQSTGCTECHFGPALNGWDPGDDEAVFVEFPRNLDSSFVRKYDLDSDRGRAEATQQESDAHQFKTPVLRNITLTAPYMHNGNVASLAEACRVMASTQLDTDLSEDEISDLVAFMESLVGEFPPITLPRLPSRSGTSVVVEFK